MCEYEHDRIAVCCAYRVPKGRESEQIFQKVRDKP